MLFLFTITGVKNAVASSGTSLTDGQIRLIKRFTNNVVILYDSDPAGINASFRGVDMFIKSWVKCKVVLFPEEKILIVIPINYLLKILNLI